jgi:hypothetical protein
MLGEAVKIERNQSNKFQVMLLRNDSQDVEVHNVYQVDYLTIQKHLEQGGSVFITSKGSQKLKKIPQKRKKSSKHRN